MLLKLSLFHYRLWTPPSWGCSALVWGLECSKYFLSVPASPLPFSIPWPCGVRWGVSLSMFLTLLSEVVTPRQHSKKQGHYFANKGPSSQSYGFSCSHVWMWELDYKESWALKNWCFWTAVLEKTLESLLDCKEIQPVHLKGDQSWIFSERTDAEAETPILWPPDTKNWHIWKDPDAGKVWRQEEKGMTEDEMAGWYHWCDGHEFE